MSTDSIWEAIDEKMYLTSLSKIRTPIDHLDNDEYLSEISKQDADVERRKDATEQELKRRRKSKYFTIPSLPTLNGVRRRELKKKRALEKLKALMVATKPQPFPNVDTIQKHLETNENYKFEITNRVDEEVDLAEILYEKSGLVVRYEASEVDNRVWFIISNAPVLGRVDE